MEFLNETFKEAMSRMCRKHILASYQTSAVPYRCDYSTILHAVTVGALSSAPGRVISLPHM
jgi:hypothetical protein